MDLPVCVVLSFSPIKVFSVFRHNNMVPQAAEAEEDKDMEENTSYHLNRDLYLSESESDEGEDMEQDTSHYFPSDLSDSESDDDWSWPSYVRYTGCKCCGGSTKKCMPLKGEPINMIMHPRVEELKPRSRHSI